MGLAAMVNLVLEQMQQNPVAALDLVMIATIERDPGRQVRLGQPGTQLQQAPIDLGLGPLQAGDRRARQRLGPGGRAEAAARQTVDIEPVDHQDVVQGRLQRGEEADPGCLERRLVELGAGCQQAVIGPDIVGRHGGEISGRSGHQDALSPARTACASLSTWSSMASAAPR